MWCARRGLEEAKCVGPTGSGSPRQRHLYQQDADDSVTRWDLFSGVMPSVSVDFQVRTLGLSL